MRYIYSEGGEMMNILTKEECQNIKGGVIIGVPYGRLLKKWVEIIAPPFFRKIRI